MIKHSPHCRDMCCEGCPKINTISAEIELGVAALELGALRERQRVIKILETMRDETHGDAWATLDNAIDAINDVSQNSDTKQVSGNNDI